LKPPGGCGDARKSCSDKTAIREDEYARATRPPPTRSRDKIGSTSPDLVARVKKGIGQEE